MSARRLAQTLIAANLVQAADVESALQRQVVWGGSLDTNLLELGLIDEITLQHALGQATGLPHASKQDIDSIGAHVPRLFPLVFAETYHLVPMRLVEATLTTLVHEAPEKGLEDRIAQRLGLQVSHIVTSEVRLHYAMHRLYGTELLPRYMTLLTHLDGAPPVSLVPETERPAGEHVLSWGVSSARIAPTRGAGGKSLTGSDVRSLVARLDAAPDRDSIVEVLLSFALTMFEFAGLFLVQGDQVHGWRGTTPESTQRVAQISLPLALPSVFQTIYATQGPYLGPLPNNSINNGFVEALGRTAPRAACLAPIMVGGRLVAILYADNGARGVSPKRVAALLVLLQRSGWCLENLIRRRKGAAAKLMSESVAEAAVTVPQPAALPPIPRPAEDELDFSDLEVAPRQAELRSAPDSDIAIEITPAAEAAPTQAGAPLPEHAGAGRKSRFGNVEADGFADLTIDIEHHAAVAEPESEAYVAFADLNETPEGSLDEWEDVLVDTMAQGAAEDEDEITQETTLPPAMSVTWQDVIAEAAGAATIVPRTRTFDVLGTKVDERDILFDGLESDDADARHSAVASLLKLGNSIDATLSERFPGRIGFDPLDPQTRPPVFEQCSGITELVAARGAEVAPLVLPHLDSQDPVRRFFAIYFVLSVHCPNALEALARRLYDTEPRNRHLTVEALRRYSGEPAYRRIVQSLRETLRAAARDTQIATIQVLGQLREPSAVPAIIPLIATSDTDLTRSAASALAVICAQAFGTDLQRWQHWWSTSYNKPRARWLLEGLQNPNATIRRVAHNELTYLTGQSVAFDPEAPETDRQEAVHNWAQWLQNAGAA